MDNNGTHVGYGGSRSSKPAHRVQKICLAALAFHEGFATMISETVCLVMVMDMARVIRNNYRPAFFLGGLCCRGTLEFLLAHRVISHTLSCNQHSADVVWLPHCLVGGRQAKKARFQQPNIHEKTGEHKEDAADKILISELVYIHIVADDKELGKLKGSSRPKRIPRKQGYAFAHIADRSWLASLAF